MANPSAPVTIKALNQTLLVTITPGAFSDSALTTPVSFPATITTDTTYYVANPTNANISVVLPDSSTEILNQTLTLAAGQANVITPTFQSHLVSRYVGSLTAQINTLSGQVTTLAGQISGVAAGTKSNWAGTAPTFYRGPVTVVEAFPTGNSWTQDSGSPGTVTVAQASGVAHLGSTLMRFVTDAVAGVSSASVTGKTAVDLSGITKAVRLWIYLQGAQQIYGAIKLIAASAGGLSAGNYITWDLANTSIGAEQALVTATKMTPLTLSVGDATVTGSPTMSAITEWRVQVAGRTTGPAPGSVTAFIDGIEVVGNGLQGAHGTNGTVVFTFDDSFDGQYTIAREELGLRGWTGTIFPIIDQIGVTNCMTSTQLRAMHDERWEVGIHSYAKTVHDSYQPKTDTAAAAQGDYALARAWLSDNGFRGGLSHAYPNGVFGTTTGSGATPYSQLASKWFRVARTTSYNYPGAIINPGPLDEPMKVRAITVGGTSAPTVAQMVATGGIIDRCKAANGVLVFTMHQLSSSTATGPLNILQADLQSILNKVSSNGMAVATLGQVIDSHI